MARDAAIGVGVGVVMAVSALCLLEGVNARVTGPQGVVQDCIQHTARNCNRGITSLPFGG